MRWWRLAIVAVGLAGAAAPAQETQPALLSPPAAAPTTAPAQVSVAPPQDDIAGFVDGYIRAAVDQQGLPSASIVLVRDGRIILSKAYGYADLEKRLAASTDATLYRQASISKLFTWLLVMQLVEQGKLDLDRDVNTYLDFRIPPAFGKPITLRDLMTHTPGFDERLRGVFDPGVPKPIRQTMSGNIPSREYAPGTTMAYSNYGAALGGYIAERAAGVPFEQLVEDRIFRPLRMTRSTFRQPVPASLGGAVAKGYLPGSREALDFEWVATTSAGGMSATPADMGRFLAMLAGGGALNDVRIVSPQSIATMMRLQRPVAAGASGGYGLGFMVGEHKGVRHAGHGGNLAGTATYIGVLPDHGIGWYVAFNGQGANGNAANRVRGELGRLMADRFARQQVPLRPIPAAQSTAKDAAGIYLSARRIHHGFLKLADALGYVEVTPEKDGALTVSTAKRSDGSLRRWVPIARDRFAEEETGSPLVLVRGADGRVTRIGGEMLSPVAVLERAPNWVGSASIILGAAMGVMVLAALSVPAGWLLRSGYRRPQLPRYGLSRRTLPLARLGVWIVVGVAVAWIVYLTRAEQEIALLTSASDTNLLLLRIATGLGALMLVIILIDGIIAWGDPTRGWPRRLGVIATSASAVLLLWAIVQFELLTFGLSF
ncbi:serine hydrolase domain-containing protein [Sphingoaurantiacus capsulatus]|uniref:Serine hydrolase domain-containing protein n=1 Tax=Sphingoaurantiacus capsulatus TaxID=1771310 RepID=A0ABV7XDZ5_9SPHN